ncbi:pyridoxamine 5'-phosphate oxidase [Williamsia sp. MIQD14]|uniref:pyridoxamine 5'-phosphate oxidase n=1 Tax=Williamsia sp. MIQD14 TaxID=3425703 RepID=UPI003DA07019
MRVGYGSAGGGGLGPESLTGDPLWLDLFERWLADGVARSIPEPNAMVVATVDADGVPATRTVLCKAVDDRGIVFYTNHDSDKGRHLAAEPVASATFPWIAMERQVHFRGPVVQIARAETQAYWDSRPRGSQLGAHASTQSHPIASRADLEAQARAVADRFEGDEPVPLPENWGGYRIEPTTVEFWQGGADRLHDRVRALRDPATGRWDARRLQP